MNDTIEIPRLSVLKFNDNNHIKALWDVFKEYHDKISPDFSNYLDIRYNIISKYCFGWCYSKNMPAYMQSCMDYEAIALMFGANSKDLIIYSHETYIEFWFHETPRTLNRLKNEFSNIKFLGHDKYI